MGDNLLGNSAAFVLVLGVTFTTGAFLGGWLALKQGWLKAEPRLRLRLAPRWREPTCRWSWP